MLVIYQPIDDVMQTGRAASCDSKVMVLLRVVDWFHPVCLWSRLLIGIALHHTVKLIISHQSISR